uniref:DUF551 domain-containing protein n=1 Tax=Burkholderia sp. M701 TaxID=326454 RepID=V5YPL4_9BURK|nr:hypothetical protein [Burkholderia sp. M701]BAO18881.1 hypothetical protein [Burkholderia sp. M701]
MDTAAQHAVALAIVHEEAGRTLSKADFDLCMRIAQRSLSSAETQVPWICVHDQPVPVSARGTTTSVIVACKRARDGETYVFAAEYANEFELDPGDDDDVRIVTGWFVTGLDTSGEFNYAYQTACGDGDEITHWMLMPTKPGTTATVAPTRRSPISCETMVSEWLEKCRIPVDEVQRERMEQFCAFVREFDRNQNGSSLADEQIADVVHLARQRWQGDWTYTLEQIRVKLLEQTVDSDDKPGVPATATQSHDRAATNDRTTINGVPVSALQGAFKQDDLIQLMKVTRLVLLAPLLNDAQYTTFLNALMHYSIKVVGWAEGRVSTPHAGGSGDEMLAAWRELARRLYVELFHCDQQMRSTRDEDGEPHWTQSSVVRDVLRAAKAALDGGVSALHANVILANAEGNHSP